MRDFLGNLDRIDHPVDLRDSPSVRLRGNVEVHLDAANVGTLDILDANLDSRQAVCGRQSLEPCLIESDVDKCAEENVGGDAAGRVEDCDFHLTGGRGRSVMRIKISKVGEG